MRAVGWMVAYGVEGGLCGEGWIVGRWVKLQGVG